jgi:hypothetical protein
MNEFEDVGMQTGDFMFELGPIFMGVIFFIVIGTFLFVIIKGIAQWNYNNSQPELTVSAEVKTKRTRVSGGANDTSASTSYYVTFEIENGVRMEFWVKAQEYGQLAEGDQGTLSYQGTRFLGFQRMKQIESF